MRKIFNGLLMVSVFVFAFCFLCTDEKVHAATSSDTTSTTETKVITTPVTAEPSNSDLTLLHANTKLASSRWIQSFTKDSKYYYFVQMTGPKRGNLRITRVRYIGSGLYTKDHMDLVGFGHGTNIDCSVYNGQTYLWIGSGMDKKSKETTSISCFKYKKDATYTKKAGHTFRIRIKGSLRKATNVFPAVSQDNKYLYVRYTQHHRQYFQKYRIHHGNSINANWPSSKISVSATAGDFQGFDVYKNYIYTIEGSPTALFLSSYDKSRVYQPTKIRVINMRTGSKRTRVIKGGKCLTFREPEGIKIYKNGKAEIMFVSNTLKKQRCNIYRLKHR